MGTAKRLTMSAEEYLAWEEQQETKHEFLAGLVYEVFPMAGARDAHVTTTLEALSPSTADHDRGGKFAIYREIETRRGYALIDPSRRSVDQFEDVEPAATDAARPL